MTKAIEETKKKFIGTINEKITELRATSRRLEKMGIFEKCPADLLKQHNDVITELSIYGLSLEQLVSIPTGV